MHRVDDRLVKRSVDVHQDAVHVENNQFWRQLHRIPSMARSTLRVSARVPALMRTKPSRGKSLRPRTRIPLRSRARTRRSRRGTKIREHEIRAARINPRAQAHEALFQHRAALQNFARVVAQKARIANRRFRRHERGRIHGIRRARAAHRRQDFGFPNKQPTRNAASPADFENVRATSRLGYRRIHGRIVRPAKSK